MPILSMSKRYNITPQCNVIRIIGGEDNSEIELLGYNMNTKKLAGHLRGIPDQDPAYIDIAIEFKSTMLINTLGIN